MRKMIFVLMFVCFARTVIAGNYEYLSDHCWQLHYQIYPPVNGEIWIKGPALIFSTDGIVLNQNRNRITGRWYPNQNPRFIHVWLKPCGKIKGWFLFERNSSILKGCGIKPSPKQEKVSFFLIRNYKIKNQWQ